MASIAREQTSNCANPVLDIFFTQNGVLTDVSSLEYEIFEDVSTPGTPVKVYPAGPGRAVVTLTLCPAGQKLSTGRYVAVWPVPALELVGRHVIKWYAKLNPTSPEKLFQEEFEVLDSLSGSGAYGYALVQDLRDEGFTDTVAYPDAMLMERIERASRMVEMYTGQYFEPRTKTLTVDGRGRRYLLLDEPVIGVSSIKISTNIFSPADGSIDLSAVRIYNRHISQNLTRPDDRRNPKVEFVHFNDRFGVPNDIGGPYRITNLVWPYGQQNVQLEGVFGFTEYDGSSTGRTPTLIKHVTKLLAVRELPKMADSDARADNINRWRVMAEKTRHQSISYGNISGGRNSGGGAAGRYTGDPEIDRILEAFRRVPVFAAT